MAASTRFSAKNIIFTIGATSYACDATRVALELNDAPGDVRTFCEVSVGKEWKLTPEGIVSGDVTSLYQVLFASYTTDVAFKIAPAGNAVATANLPHYTGTVTIDDLPPLDLNAAEIVKFSVTLTVKNTVNTPTSTPAVFWGVTKVVS